MKHLEVFDPAMCCSTGVCGPKVDPVLPHFAADLEWLATQGVRVSRYNLAQQAPAFAANPLVAAALQTGMDCLPLLVLDGHVVSRGAYPERAALRALVGLAAGEATSPAAETRSCGCASGRCD